MHQTHPNHHAPERGGCSCLGELLSTVLVAVLVTGLLGMAFSAGWAEEEPGSAGCDVSNRFPAQVRRWCGLITGYARQADLPPDLVAALIWQESGGNPDALSHSGAVGLMQVMPRDGRAAAFQCKGRPCFTDRPSMAELRDPEFNLRYGTRLLSSLVKKYQGDLRKALRAYGPMDMGYGYADIVLSLYEKYGRP